MAWQLFEPNHNRLSPGFVTIGSRGLCQITPKDLRRIGCTRSATLKLEPDGPKIAICPPGEDRHRVAITKVSGGRCVRISLGAAMNALGMDPKDHAGRRCLVVIDGTLVIDFGKRE